MQTALPSFLHSNSFVCAMNSAKKITVMVEDGWMNGWMDDKPIDGQLVVHG